MAAILSRPQCVKTGANVINVDDPVPIWCQDICNHLVNAPGQWETALLCNIIFHCLVACTKWSLCHNINIKHKMVCWQFLYLLDYWTLLWMLKNKTHIQPTRTRNAFESLGVTHSRLKNSVVSMMLTQLRVAKWVVKMFTRCFQAWFFVNGCLFGPKCKQ